MIIAMIMNIVTMVNLGGGRTYCQEGGGDGQGAGSKNLKKEKLEQIYSCDDRMGNMYFGSF